MKEKDIWQKDWPLLPGNYWFYGILAGGSKKQMIPVKVIQVSNGLLYMGSEIMFEEDGHEGVWLVAPADPEPPTEC